MTTTSTEPIAPPHIDLGEIPPTDDIPEPARSLVATWQLARDAAERAGMDYLDGITEARHRGYTRMSDLEIVTAAW